jgi:FixJ family two-component response regulator
MNQTKINVAVVDDDDSFGRAIGRLLRAAGFEPVGYSSAEAFLEDTTHTPPDCLVLDIHLGGASGLELRRHLTALGSAIPVIFVTAHDAPGIREEVERAGCAAYFRKPVPGHLLISAITEAVHPSRQ